MGSGVGEMTAVVVRYYGGVLLGPVVWLKLTAAV
jgi:putative IMPACT (imprinted ancient) family translation regulator